MSAFSLRGKSFTEWISAVQWRLTLPCRHFLLGIQRRWKAQREHSWLASAPDIGYVLTSRDARQILKKHPEEQRFIVSVANDVVSGWTYVSGFGRRRIILDPGAFSSNEEAYAYRLLSRLDFLKPLTRAALIAEDAGRYITAVEAILTQWRAVRGKRCHWDSVDEAIRVLNIIETLALLQKELKQQAFQAGLEAVLDAAWTVQAQRARTGNHLIYEGLALFYLGCCLRGHVQADVWRKLGTNILKKALRLQVLSDGMNAELNTSYHLITGTNFTKASVMGCKFDVSFPVWFIRKTAQMAIVASKLRAVDGGFFPFGDSDRMAGFSREEKEARAFTEWGENIAHPSQNRTPSLELDFLLAGVEFSIDEELSESAERSYMQAGGYQILQYRPRETVIFDTGHLGLSGASHHGHADALSFLVNLSDSRFMVDPGGFSYVDKAARKYARSTAAHNTVRIDGLDSSEMLGSFSFGRGARARLTDVHEFEGGVVLSAEHDGYTRLQMPVIHRRALIILTGFRFCLVVVDRLEGEGEHLVEAFFHADDDWKADIPRGNSVLWSKDQHSIQHCFWCRYPLEARVVKGEKFPEWQGWVAPTFGTYLPAPVLVERCRAPLPVDIVNVFLEADDTGDELGIDCSDKSLNIDNRLKYYWKWETSHLKVALR